MRNLHLDLYLNFLAGFNDASQRFNSQTWTAELSVLSAPKHAFWRELTYLEFQKTITLIEEVQSHLVRVTITEICEIHIGLRNLEFRNKIVFQSFKVLKNLLRNHFLLVRIYHLVFDLEKGGHWFVVRYCWRRYASVKHLLNIFAAEKDTVAPSWNTNFTLFEFVVVCSNFVLVCRCELDLGLFQFWKYVPSLLFL